MILYYKKSGTRSRYRLVFSTATISQKRKLFIYLQPRDFYPQPYIGNCGRRVEMVVVVMLKQRKFIYISSTESDVHQHATMTPYCLELFSLRINLESIYNLYSSSPLVSNRLPENIKSLRCWLLASVGLCVRNLNGMVGNVFDFIAMSVPGGRARGYHDVHNY